MHEMGTAHKLSTSLTTLCAVKREALGKGGQDYNENAFSVSFKQYREFHCKHKAVVRSNNCSNVVVDKDNKDYE